MTQAIDIKGLRDGLLIRVKDYPDVAVVEALGEELARKREFLVGSRIAVDVGRREPDDA